MGIIDPGNWPQLPPLPEGALGWNVYEGSEFVGFAPDEDAVAREAVKFADDVESFTAREQP